MTREYDPDDRESWDSFVIRKQLALGRIRESEAVELLEAKGETLETAAPLAPRPTVAAGEARESLGEFRGEQVQYDDNYDSVNKDALVDELSNRAHLEDQWTQRSTKDELIAVLRRDDAAQAANSEG